MKSGYKLLAPIVTAMALLPAPAAIADSSNCWTSLFKLGITNCSTPPVRHSPAGHIYFEVGPMTRYIVWDVVLDVPVADGNTGAGTYSRNIFGLTNLYSVEIWGSPVTAYSSYAYINNT